MNEPYKQLSSLQIYARANVARDQHILLLLLVMFIEI